MSNLNWRTGKHGKYLRENKNKFEDHGNKTTVKESEIMTLKALEVRYWNKWGGGGQGNSCIGG